MGQHPIGDIVFGCLMSWCLFAVFVLLFSMFSDTENQRLIRNIVIGFALFVELTLNVILLSRIPWYMGAQFITPVEAVHVEGIPKTNN